MQYHVNNKVHLYPGILFVLQQHRWSIIVDYYLYFIYKYVHEYVHIYVGVW